MGKVLWFHTPTNGPAAELVKAHARAYEKSLRSAHAVKAQSGSYYYKGFAISNDGGRLAPWSYNRAEADDFEKEWAETKKLAMEYIDDILARA